MSTFISSTQPTNYFLQPTCRSDSIRPPDPDRPWGLQNHPAGSSSLPILDLIRPFWLTSFGLSRYSSSAGPQANNAQGLKAKVRETLFKAEVSGPSGDKTCTMGMVSLRGACPLPLPGDVPLACLPLVVVIVVICFPPAENKVKGQTLPEQSLPLSTYIIAEIYLVSGGTYFPFPGVVERRDGHGPAGLLRPLLPGL